MPIVSSVIHVESSEIRKLVANLGHDTRITLGNIIHGKVPIVFESMDPKEDRQFWCELERLPSIKFIQYIFADFSDIHIHEKGVL